MKRHIFSFALLMGFASPVALAKDTSAQLSIQKSSALPAHLTTRVEWRQFPQLNYNNDDLQGQDRAAILRVVADETGSVTQAKIQESTGIKKLDDLLVKATQNAQVKAYEQDGNLLPTIGYQTFNLDFKENNHSSACIYHFDSYNWLRQQSNKATPFQYIQQPVLNLDRDALKGKDRLIRFNFKVNKQGDVSKIKIGKGSGIYALDAQIMQTVSSAQVNVPRKFWIFKKSHLKDEIRFKIDHCQN